MILCILLSFIFLFRVLEFVLTGSQLIADQFDLSEVILKLC